MPSFELSKLQATSAPRALSESDRTQLSSNSPNRTGEAKQSAQEPGVALEISSSVNASTPPFDNDRVEQIRDALRDGSYPLVPTEIADAMIASRLSLSVSK